MLPVMQTITDTDPERGVVGDCWRTAIASCFDIADPTHVPHFIAMPDTTSQTGVWWHETRRWVRSEQQMETCWHSVKTLSAIPEILKGIRTDVHPYAILTGHSPRGAWLHAVVVELTTGKIVHDPHPKGNGNLLGLVDVTYFEVP